MASLGELIELNTQGDLCKLLVEKFHGKHGRLNPRRDSDFMIGFESHEKTPTAREIEQAVTTHYTELGYTVEPTQISPPDMFEASAFYQD